MFGIFDKSFKEINLDDIEKLKSSDERENQFLDYKLKFIADDLVSDICAMANAQGGYILVGISEKEKEKGYDDGYPDEIIGIEECECNAKILREKAKDLIDPNILGFQDKPIKIDGSHSILVVQVPNSNLKPHYVRKTNKYGPFPIRVGRTTNYWTMGDVRSQIISHMNIDDRIEKIINHSLQNNLLSDNENPLLSFFAFPTYGPFNDVDLSSPDIKDIVRFPDRYIPKFPLGLNSDIYRFTLEGFQGLKYLESRLHSFLQLYRNGMLEFSSKFTLSDELKIKLFLTLSQLCAFISVNSKLSSVGQLFGPVTYCININNIKGAIYDSSPYTSQLIEPRGVIEFKVTYQSAFEEIIPNDLCLRITNAFGLEDLPSDVRSLAEQCSQNIKDNYS